MAENKLYIAFIAFIAVMVLIALTAMNLGSGNEKTLQLQFSLAIISHCLM